MPLPPSHPARSRSALRPRVLGAPTRARGRASAVDRAWARPRRARGLFRPRRRVRVGDLLLGVGFVALGAYLGWAFWSATRVDVDVAGVADGAHVTPAAVADLEVRFTVPGTEARESARLVVNGEAPDSETVDATLRAIAWRPGELAEGRYEVVLSVPRLLLGDSTFRRSFVVDATPPPLQVEPLQPAVDPCTPVRVEGRVEPGSRLTADGEAVKVGRDGGFVLAYDDAPLSPVHVVATDAAGNTTAADVTVPTRYPGGQGVHVTAAGWAHEPTRAHVLSLVDRGLVNVVELDLKDEGGVVGYDSRVELGRRIGAVQPSYVLRDAVRELERRGARVIGRVVAFRDPILAGWAWASGQRDWVAQTASGGMLGAYGGFTNFANAEVRAYNVAIATEAAAAGVDDILWDYVRRPEGDLASMRFPGIVGTPVDSIVGFLEDARAELREHCAQQGASVFGVAADRPDEVGQDAARMARHLDYVAPMVYPSHWARGEYGVADPNRQPYDIVRASLEVFRTRLQGTGVPLVPWLQDFSLGHRYGPAEVRAQIDAARDLGITSWLLWNPGARYTDAALDAALVAP